MEKVNPFEKFDKQWALVTSGNIDHFNTMTISWGSMGTLWHKPIITIYIKPVRYTYNFLEENDYFTVSFFDHQYKGDLMTLGTTSGRDGDKVALTGLHPVSIGDYVGFKEAKTTFICKKIYSQSMDQSFMPEDVVCSYYMDEAEHKMFIGEVIEEL